MTETTTTCPPQATPGQQHLDQMIELVTELTSENWKQSREIIRLKQENGELRQFVNKVSASQAEALSTIRTAAFVFRTDLRRNDLSGPERWEKLAFTLYTRLVDLSSQAEQVLEAYEEAQPANGEVEATNEQ